MEEQKNKPLFSERLTFQVTPEVKTKLLELADQQYGGDRQALGREALEGWLNREYTRRSYTARIVETLDELGEEVARKKDLGVILEKIDSIREDVAPGAIIEEILYTVKKLREDVLMWNHLIAGLLERLGVKSKP